MNTRGLTELIVLNIGLSLGCDIALTLYDAGDYGAGNDIITTSPLLEWTYPKTDQAGYGGVI